MVVSLAMWWVLQARAGDDLGDAVLHEPPTWVVLPWGKNHLARSPLMDLPIAEGRSGYVTIVNGIPLVLGETNGKFCARAVTEQAHLSACVEGVPVGGWHALIVEDVAVVGIALGDPPSARELRTVRRAL